jgi:hypothetical protein
MCTGPCGLDCDRSASRPAGPGPAVGGVGGVGAAGRRTPPVRETASRPAGPGPVSGVSARRAAARRPSVRPADADARRRRAPEPGSESSWHPIPKARPRSPWATPPMTRKNSLRVCGASGPNSRRGLALRRIARAASRAAPQGCLCPLQSSRIALSWFRGRDSKPVCERTESVAARMNQVCKEFVMQSSPH